MENKRIVVGNMKMNLTVEEVSEYLKEVNNKIYSSRVVICPTSIYIPYFLKHHYRVGLQNTSFKSDGAYTGEISPKQAVSMGISYTIIGHSERRINFNEDDMMINKKIQEAIKYNLRVILCVGETKEEKGLLKTDRVLKRELTHALRDLDESMFGNIIIAYEPIWSIGTNVVPTNKEIKDTVDYIRMIVNQICDTVEVPILYGGSVNDKNVKELNKIENIAGFLVGGASIEPQKFLKIIDEVVVNQ